MHSAIFSEVATRRAITAINGPKSCARMRMPPLKKRRRKKRSSVLDAQTGQRFRAEILETGGSRPAIASFKAFRGRAPTIDALLRQHGMSAASSIHAD